MSKLHFSIDAKALAAEMKSLKDEVEKSLVQGVKQLSSMTYSKVAELASTKLKSTRQKYMDALEYKEVQPGLWVVSLDESAMWIEEGKPAKSMVEDLLRNNAKTAKDGCVLNPRNKILTSLGWKKIKDIKAGDMVLTHSGKFREVKKLLVQKAGVGTKYVNFKIKSFDSSITSENRSDLSSPSISLTIDHLVLTPGGWKEAGKLKTGDLVAAPSDLKRKCLFCSNSLPINTPKVEFCLNNKCARKFSYKMGKGLSSISQEQKIENSKKGNLAAKISGVFERPDWGARNPKVLQKLRDASAKAMRKLLSAGNWHPEVFFEEKLKEKQINFKREFAIKSDRIVNAGNGKLRKSVLFFDFYFPEIKVAIELDGEKWHSSLEAMERDNAKNKAAERDGIKLIRMSSNLIYKNYKDLTDKLELWHKNHSGELGVCWVRVGKIKKGTVNRPDHVYSKKYDICLEDEEHSFCCETIFIHNSRYKVIPFDHGKSPSMNTPKAQEIVDQIKRELRAVNVPFKKIEYNADGSPRLGKLHTFNFPSERPSRAASHPALSGLSIYQRKLQSGKVKRDIMTFRVVSSKHAGSKWMHPGLEAQNLMDEAFEWAMKTWDNEILPAIMEKFR